MYRNNYNNYCLADQFSTGEVNVALPGKGKKDFNAL